MTSAFIGNFTYALGDVVNSVVEAEALNLTRSNAQDLADAGFVQHHVCSDGLSAYDLARQAVEGIQAQLSDIDAIVYSTCIPINGNVGSHEKFQETRDAKHLMDYPGSRLQADFGLSKAVVIGINQQACTGMLGSLYIAKVLIDADRRMQRILCVTADRFPPGAMYEQSYNLISDGAAACIVSNEPSGFKIVACHAVTNGAMSLASDDETVGSFFNYSHRVIHETLSHAGMSVNDIDWIVPQNTNLVAWELLSRLLPFEHDRIYHPTLNEVGHVISGDNIINLKHLLDHEKVRTGDRVLLFMAGYGLNWQCIVLEKCL
jgi:3-oxoacyl-[acyl-carrier-protein] synthase-3